MTHRNRNFQRGGSRPVETLERRTMMSGDVGVTFAGGDLSITGDDDDNRVRITAPAAGTIRVTGLDETTVNGEDFVEFSGEIGDLRVNTRQGGEDGVEVQGPLTISGDVTARLGLGELVIEGSAGPVDILGGVSVRPGGKGDVNFRNDVTVRGEARIQTGAQASAAAGFGFLPDRGAATFSDPLDIDNPYFPLLPGTTYTYEEESVDEETGETVTERIVVEVTDETKTVAGVVNRVLRDRVFVDGLLVEDTRDWHAQDDAGNVWYFGEESTDFEYDDDGNLIGTSTETSWEAGVDGAKPGIIMLAEPTPGEAYYQEFEPGVALDQGEVLATNDSVSVMNRTFNDVLRTKDVSVLSPGSLEHKFYSPGLGLIQEIHIDPQSGETDTTLRLISVERDGQPVTQVVDPIGFQGTNATGDDRSGPVRFLGEMSITSQGPVVLRETRFAEASLIYSRDDITVVDSAAGNGLTLLANGSAAVNNTTVTGEGFLRAGGDAYVFDADFTDSLAVRFLGSGDNDLVIGGSNIALLNADGGRGDNTLEDRGDNVFDVLEVRRMEVEDEGDGEADDDEDEE